MKITARERKFLIVGGAVCAVVLVVYLASMVLPSREDLSGTVKFKEELLRRQKWTIGQEDLYKTRIAQYQGRLDGDFKRFLPGDNPSSAGAELLKVLQGMADDIGVEVTRKTVRGDQKLQDNVIKVSVNIETNCDPEQLVRFLTSVANYGKFLTVDELTITGLRLRNRYQIRPNITVAGYILAAGGKPEEKPAQ